MSSGLDWERFGVITGGDEVSAFYHPPLVSEKGVGIPTSSISQIKIPNGWRTIKSLVHKIRLHGRRGKGMAKSFSREKLRHGPQKEGG